jgi:F-type H+-transporting ATPase subunit epsilon
MSSFLLEIITPQRIAFSEQVAMVTAPSADGEIGVLPHHVPLFTRLVEGEVKIARESDEIYLAIGGGFLEGSKQKVILLVNNAYRADEINETEGESAKKRAEEALAASPTGDDLVAAQALFRRSVIALKVLKRRRTGRTM